MKPDLIIVTDYAHVSGGAEKVGIVSAKGLAQRGYRVTLFSCAGPIDDELAATPGVEVVTAYDRYSYHDLGRIKRRTQGAWNKETEAKFASVLSGRDPYRTIVHVHSWRDQLTSSIFQPLQSFAAPVVMTVHDYGLACPMGGFYDYRLNHACRLTGGSQACMLRNCIQARMEFKLWYFWKYRLMLRRAHVRERVDRFLFVSDFARRHLVDYLPAATPQQVLDNPIEVTQKPFSPRETGAPFTYLGRLTAEKDPVTFALAAKQIGVRPLFVGSGALESAVREANPEAEVTGWVGGDVVQAKLANARALVFPSRWYEAQPLVILEALANGVPCLVSDASAAREMISEGVNGLVFRAGDVEDCAAKLRELSSDDLDERMGRAAYEGYWAEPKTLDRHLAALETVYEELLRP
ncbi:MAG: glycosyltransferase family 4 protein [Fimbriimonadaceae bacterium]|nr:glycosyltransferase family 4 protein [Fimbriimonadaceae bacterium]